MPNLATNSILPVDLGTQNRGPNTFVSTKTMLWHNAIIDDILAHPGTTQKAIAERLGKSPVTIGYIVNSDLFKFQLAKRREQYTRDLDERLIGKLAQVAEKSLDLTLEVLEKKQTAVPLALLHDIGSKSLERLGYGPKPIGASVQVNVQQNNTTGVVAPVSAEALASARQSLRTIESSRLADPVRSDPRPTSPASGESDPLRVAVAASRDGEESEGAL